MEKNGIYIEVGSGELIDKITILQIKRARIAEPEKLRHINYELDMLQKVRDGRLAPSPMLTDLTHQLKSINEALWDIEDDIRACEAANDFGEKFVQLARQVYMTNDKRAAAKKQINLLTGAAVVEEKSYTEFD